MLNEQCYKDLGVIFWSNFIYVTIGSFMKNLVKIILICSTFFTSSVGICGIYKWVDSEGKVHYGSSPPPATVPKEIKVKKSH